MADAWGYEDTPRLDVRRMLQRRRQHRQRLHARLAESIESEADSDVAPGTRLEAEVVPKPGEVVAEPEEEDVESPESEDSDAESEESGEESDPESTASGDPASPATTTAAPSALPGSPTALPDNESSPSDKTPQKTITSAQPASFVTISAPAGFSTITLGGPSSIPTTSVESALPIRQTSTASTTAGTDDASVTSPPEKESTNADAAESNTGSSGTGVSRAAGAGIALGTLALVALVIAAVMLIYRRRKRANVEHLGRLPPEKPPIPYPKDEVNKNLPRRQSSIMDEAMNAAYANDHGFYNVASKESTNGDVGNEKGNGGSTRGSELFFQSLTVPPLAFNAPGQARDQQSSPPEEAGPSAGVSLHPKPYAPLLKKNLEIYPAGQVPIPKYRVQSMAQTEATDSTETSWRIWNDRRTGSGGKIKSWKDRYLS